MQEEREEAPVESLKVPAGQAVAFMEDRGQKDPAGHRMGTPLEQYEPAGQATQLRARMR